MKPLTEALFLLAPPGGIFDDTVIATLFPDRSEGARRVLLHRARAAGEVMRLKENLYILASPYRKSSLHPFALALLLLSPSHVSLESALNYYGLIPETVRHVTCVSTTRSREFRTPLGIYSFQRVPSPYPRAGIVSVPVGDGQSAFLATPLRAIADMVFARRDVSWSKDGTAFLTDSLRIDPEDLAAISFEDFDDVMAAIRSHRTRRYLHGLRKLIDHA